MSGDNQVELARNVAINSGGPSDNWANVDLDASTHVGAGAPAADFYRYVNATAADSSYFHKKVGDDDFFVDIAYPLTTFQTATGNSFSSTYGVALATSASHEVLNKDLPDSGWGTFPNLAPFRCSGLGWRCACTVGALGNADRLQGASDWLPVSL